MNVLTHLLAVWSFYHPPTITFNILPVGFKYTGLLQNRCTSFIACRMASLGSLHLGLVSESDVLVAQSLSGLSAERDMTDWTDSWDVPLPTIFQPVPELLGVVRPAIIRVKIRQILLCVI